MALRAFHTLRPQLVIPIRSNKPFRNCKFSVQNSFLDPKGSHKLVLEVKQKLEKEHQRLPVGKNGRDDEDMIFWFLKDQKFQVEEAVAKLTKAIKLKLVEKWILWTVEHILKKWRQEFGVSELSEELLKTVASSGKAYVHDFLDVNDQPVLIMVASKHFPAVNMQDSADDEKFCVFLIEKALSMLPTGKEEILGIFDLRGFGPQNTDLKFIIFLFEVLHYYYPGLLSQVLFVEAPFVFKPIWHLAKPLLKSYASLVRFCSVETVKKEYFTEATLPAIFKD